MACLALDAMGVIFQAADDVVELLVPFIAEQGGSSDSATIDAAYLEASLGRIDADTFWTRVGLDASGEAEFLGRHRLMPGLTELLQAAQTRGIPVWCLSNDVGRWSQTLRREFGLDPYFEGVVISGDVGLRKPDARIYRHMLDASGYAASEWLFVDDRAKNVAASRALGIDTHHFDPESGFTAVHTWLEKADS